MIAGRFHLTMLDVNPRKLQMGQRTFCIDSQDLFEMVDRRLVHALIQIDLRQIVMCLHKQRVDPRCSSVFLERTVGVPNFLQRISIIEKYHLLVRIELFGLSEIIHGRLEISLQKGKLTHTVKPDWRIFLELLLQSLGDDFLHSTVYGEINITVPRGKEITVG